MILSRGNLIGEDDALTKRKQRHYTVTCTSNKGELLAIKSEVKLLSISINCILGLLQETKGSWWLSKDNPLTPLVQTRQNTSNSSPIHLLWETNYYRRHKQSPLQI